MSDREQAIKDVAGELGCDADILSHQMDMDLKFICNNGEYKVYAVQQRERVIELERDNAAKAERVIQLERSLREIRKIFDRQNNAICGNEQLSGCEEFYKGYNAIVRQENEASRVGLKIIDAALEGK